VLHLWNGRWSRVARRDVWLWPVEGCWCVEVRRGGPTGRRRLRTFRTEQEALVWIADRVIAGEDGWREPKYLATMGV
jgi:hypothetical protein